MKIAILLLHVGGGHMEAANNIKLALEEQQPGCEVKIIDGLAESPAIWEWFFKFTWNTVQNKVQWLWDFMYNSKIFSSKLFAWWMYHFPWWGLRRAIREFGPDAVITTHYVCTPISINLRKKEGIPKRVNYVVTEYIWHPEYFWWPEADHYYIASEMVKKELDARGYPAEQIHLTGIPIKKAFAEPLERSEARQTLGLPQDATILFFFAGTFGGTAIDELIAGIKSRHVFPVVVCGKNQALKERLEALLKKEGIEGKVYGFVDFMNVIMAACDLMVGKGGALSCAETLATATPILLYGSPPGHELENAEYLQRLGAGRVTQTIPDVLETVADLLDNPEKLEAMREASRKHGKARAAEEVAATVLDDANRALAGGEPPRQLAS